jgi:hypothetical protein
MASLLLYFLLPWGMKIFSIFFLYPSQILAQYQKYEKLQVDVQEYVVVGEIWGWKSLYCGT